MNNKEIRTATITAAESVGSAASAHAKMEAALQRITDSKNEYTAELLKAYVGGNRRPLKVSALQGITAENGNNSEVYKAAVLKLWTNAIDWVDNDNTETDSAMFTAWQEYLTLFEVPAAAKDRKRIAAAVLKAVTEGIAYERHTTNSGEVAARMTRGIKSCTTASLAPFTRNIEAFAAERVLDLDGVVSRAAAREIAKANKAKREETIAAAVLTPAAEVPAETATKAKAKKTAKAKKATKAEAAAAA